MHKNQCNYNQLDFRAYFPISNKQTENMVKTCIEYKEQEHRWSQSDEVSRNSFSLTRFLQRVLVCRGFHRWSQLREVSTYRLRKKVFTGGLSLARFPPG